MKDIFYKYINRLKKVLDSFPYDKFKFLIEAFLNAYKRGTNIFIMGNGGSASTASHWACDINKSCSLQSNKRFKMICLNDNISTMLAYANDLSYEDIFVEQMKNYFSKGDLVIGISGSGNSLNVLKAIDYAREHGGITVGLCGFSGGKLCNMVDIPILIKIDDMQIVEDVHLIVAHMTMQRLSYELNRF